MSDGPIAAYRRRVAAGQLHPDPTQELAAQAPQVLHARLRHWQPMQRGGWRDRLGLGLGSDKRLPPRGLYLYGGVGRGWGGASMARVIGLVVDEIALGTDYPFPLGELEPGNLIESSNYSDQKKNKLLFENALDWLGLSHDHFK